jgi:competence protein ComEC
MVVRVLDVGQGDAILLQPPGAEPVLVDTGPPGSDLADDLSAAGVESLAAVVITHDQSDHSGGLGALLRSLDVARVITARSSPDLEGLASAAGAETVAIAEGGELSSGELRLAALWPPRERLAASMDDPNADSLVLLAEWRHLSLLLCGDAEAELVPIDPGPIDILKVAHHGSEDAGLTGLVERSAPKLAVVSVGRNPYGHPAPETLTAIGEHDVRIARTDTEGDVVIEADAAGWWIAG